MLPLEERLDDLVFGLDRGRNQHLFQFGVLGRCIEQQAELAIESLLARQRIDSVENLAELIEELIRDHPFGFLARRCRSGNVRDLCPFDRLHLSVEILQRISDDLVDDLLNRFPVLGRVVLEDPGNGVGERGRAAQNICGPVRFQAAPPRTGEQVESGLRAIWFA